MHNKCEKCNKKFKQWAKYAAGHTTIWESKCCVECSDIPVVTFSFNTEDK